MTKTNSNAGAAMNEALERTLSAELYLNDNYHFRRNVLNGKVEFTTNADANVPPNDTSGEVESDTSGDTTKAPDEAPQGWRTLTPEALNSIVRKAKKEQVCPKGSPRTEIVEYVNSEDIPRYNPIDEFFKSLPEWDGQNHIAKLFSRLPGITSEQQGFLATWLLSAAAHWLQMDQLHGNECVPTLIGEQGCGKTTFLRRILPPGMQDLFLGHLNIGNKFDKEMALTNNLLVNIDELETIKSGQQATLKQTLSKSRVNGRPIFGTCQEDRPRYASFVASTNNRHPLTDPTGSRRFICLTIPDGQLIDNEGDIDYGQLYAQVLHELTVAKTPYWFSNDEVKRIQQLNQDYQAQHDIAEMVAICFRKPKDGEVAQVMNSTALLTLIQRQYPSVAITHGNRVRLGNAMNEFGFESVSRSNVAHYKVIPMVA